MPTWIIIILVVALIGGIIGFIGSEDGSRKEGAAAGAVYGAIGCGQVLLHLFLWGLGILLVLKLFGAIFG